MSKINHKFNDLEIKSRFKNEPDNQLDIQKFISKYKPSKYKVLKNGIEVRSVTNVEEAANKACELIKEMKLRLVVVRDAEMSAYRAFEVQEV